MVARKYDHVSKYKQLIYVKRSVKQLVSKLSVQCSSMIDNQLVSQRVVTSLRQALGRASGTEC